MDDVKYNDKFFYFLGVLSIVSRIGVMPSTWGKTPILYLCQVLLFLDHNEKHCKVVMRYE